MRFLTVLLLLPASASAQQVERFTVPGEEAALYNLAGSVTVEGGSGPLTVEVTRGGADASALRVEQGALRGRETLRVVYPGDEVVYAGLDRGSSTTLPVREDGTFGDPRDHERRERGRRVRISGTGGGLVAHADLRVRMPEGMKLEIYLATGKVSVANVNGDLRLDAHSAPVTTTGTRGRLSVDVGSGPVRVSRAEGDLEVDTGSGPVEVSRFRGRELLIDTGSGSVTGTDLEAVRLSVETGSGDIELAATSAPSLELETGSGSVTADLRSELQSLTVETGSGDIRVTALPTLGAAVDIETASGGIESDFPLQVTRHSRDHVVGRIGDGRGRIEIETGSGDVRLLKRPS